MSLDARSRRRRAEPRRAAPPARPRRRSRDVKRSFERALQEWIAQRASANGAIVARFEDEGGGGTATHRPDGDRTSPTARS